MNNNSKEGSRPSLLSPTILNEIINNELIEIYYQPIVSLRSNKIFALEALTRCTYNNNIISPYELFEFAKEQNLSLELDFLTRKKSIEKFKKYYEKNEDLLLFLNFEPSLINSFNSNSSNKYEFTETIDKLEIPYKNFLIEIKEDEIQNNNALEDFCKTFKKKGFAIALDDFGTGSSTFDRINLVKPDIIKIDKSLFVDIKKNLINKEIVKAISKMSHNLGIKVLAEGVEDMDAICMGLKSSIKLFQGYYFGKPESKITKKDQKYITNIVLDASKEFKKRNLVNMSNKRKTITKYDFMINEIFESSSNIDELYKKLKFRFKELKSIEAIYIIDAKTSKQVHDTIIEESKNKHFKATKHGEEHFLKEYFYVTLEAKHDKYLSQKYISYATENVCKTFAKKIKITNTEYILCLDIIV